MGNRIPRIAVIAGSPFGLSRGFLSFFPFAVNFVILLLDCEPIYFVKILFLFLSVCVLKKVSYARSGMAAISYK